MGYLKDDWNRKSQSQLNYESRIKGMTRSELEKEAVYQKTDNFVTSMGILITAMVLMVIFASVIIDDGTDAIAVSKATYNRYISDMGHYICQMHGEKQLGVFKSAQYGSAFYVQCDKNLYVMRYAS